jgi:hypothetical protein
VIEVVTGHTAPDEPERSLRRLFIDHQEASVEESDLSEAWAPYGWIPLSDRIGDMTDEEFERLIADGTIIPLRVP